MAVKLLTDVELRARWTRSREKSITIEKGTILTPAAKDFIHEQGIELIFAPADGYAAETMTRTQIPTRNGKAFYVDAATGMELSEKGENMTHLRGNILVPKTNPRIAFRGKLDSLQAQILETQLAAENEKRHQVTAELDELLAFVRMILSAEVREEPFAEIRLLNMDSKKIRHVSHCVKEEIGIDHPVPGYQMGELCVCLNKLRTQVRETELAAVYAFTDENGNCSRCDIVEALNRLSSCIYIIFCRTVAGQNQ